MKKSTKIFVALSLIIVAIASRFLPHAWNATPVSAIALLASVYLGIEYSLIIVVSSMFLSDIFLGFYSLPVMLSVYLSLFFSVVVGLLVKNRNLFTIICASMASTLGFFTITNGAVWIWSGMYLHTWNGLMTSYFMGLPFFRNQLAGDLVYTVMFFGTFALFTKVFFLEHRRHEGILSESQ